MTPPLSKTKFVRPLCEANNSANIYANLTFPIQPVAKNANLPGMHNIGDNLKQLNDMKSKQLNNLNSVHSKLFAEVEEIQKWKTSIEMESRQKNKQVEELLKTIESQRKVVLDLQLQNENLSYKLSEEVQQRSFVIEKLHSTKELCSALKKHYNSLQKQFDYRNNIENMFSIADTKRMTAIEDLTNKYEKICIEHSERVGHLNDALATETNKSLNLKEALEREVSISENEKQSLCTMLNNSQLENERLSKDLEEEINKSRALLQEKRELESNFMKLEKLNESHLSQIKEMEGNIKATEEDKLEMEKKYLSEHLKNSELKQTYEECLKNFKCFKMESEENLLSLRQTTEELESNYNNLLKRMEEEKHRNEVLTSSLKTAEDEKCHLNSVILEAEAELRLFENLKNEYKDLKENLSQLLEEKTELNIILGDTKDELSKYKSEYENAVKLYKEKSEEFLKLSEDLEAKLSLKDKKILSLREDNTELLLKYKSLEEDILSKSELVIAKNKEISKIQALLEENEEALESLRNDTIVLKENFEKERTSVKVCSECESLKDKVSELETIKSCLKKTEEDLLKQKTETKDILKMFNDYERDTNEDRISKQKEIIQYKNKLQKLENDIAIKYVEREVLDDLKSENLKLKNDLEEMEIKLQKVDCLNVSLEEKVTKLNKSPKQVMMAKSLKQTIAAKSPKQTIAAKSPKPAMADKSPIQAVVDNFPKQTKAGGKSPKPVMETNKVVNVVQNSRKNEGLNQMNAVKFRNKKVKEKNFNIAISENNISKKNISDNYEFNNPKPVEADSSNLDFCFEKKSSGKENKAWDADSSSGSEYLDISFFKETEMAPKKTFKESPKIQVKGSNRILSGSQQKRENQDVISDNVAKRPCMPYKTQTQFKPSIWTQALRTPEKTHKDALAAEKNYMNKKNTPLTPTTAKRRFFKTPLVQRDDKFKKPHVPWF